MEQKELTKLTNKLFGMYLNDLISTKGLKRSDLVKDIGVSRQFISNKINGYCIRYVSLNLIYRISTHYKFNFDLNKYIKQLNQQSK